MVVNALSLKLVWSAIAVAASIGVAAYVGPSPDPLKEFKHQNAACREAILLRLDPAYRDEAEMLRTRAVGYSDNTMRMRFDVITSQRTLHAECIWSNERRRVQRVTGLEDVA